MIENSSEVNLVHDSAQEKANAETYIAIFKSTSKKGGNKYHCNLCNAKINSENSKTLHLKGRKHLKNLEKKQRLEKHGKVVKEKVKPTNKKISGNITVVKEIAFNKIPLETIEYGSEKPFGSLISEKSKTGIEMTSVDKSMKSLSLKRGSTFHSKNQVDPFAIRSEGFIPLNNVHEFHQNYSTQGNKWNHNNNAWNNNRNYYDLHNDSNYQGSYPQYGGKKKRYFRKNDSYKNHFPTSRQDNRNQKYFSESGQFDMQFNTMHHKPNNHFNYHKNETSNSHNHKVYDKTLDSTIHWDTANDSSTKNKSENDLRITGEDFNSNEHSTSKKLSSHRNSSSPRVASVSGTAHEKIYSPRQLRSSKKGKNTDGQNNFNTRSIINSDNNAEIECSNDTDRQQDKRLPSENMSDRISHWLNPLNSRDKAEINKLLNNYSKSKKKETLLKLKLRSEESNINNENNENLFHNLVELTDRINTAESEMEHNSSNSPYPSHCLDVSPDSLTSSDKISKDLSPKPKRRKKSNLSESSCNSLDVIASSRASRRSSVGKDTDSNKKRVVRRSRASTDSCISFQKTVPAMEYETQLEELMLGKRRGSLSLSNKPKKHKCSGSECAIECAYENRSNSEESPTVKDNMNSEIYDANLSFLVNSEASSLSSQNQTESPKEALSLGMVENAKILEVEDLMKMFALENVTIKKEFDDPLIEAIRNVDVNFLMNVCDPVTATTNMSSSSINKSPCLPSIEKNCDNQSDKCAANTQSSQVKSTRVSTQLQSVTNTNDKQVNALVSETPSQLQLGTGLNDTQLNNSLTPTSSLQKQSKTNTCEMQNNVENEQPSSISNVISVRQSNKQFETFETAFPGLSPFKVYVNISNELNKLQKEEEEKRNLLKEVDKMIDEHQKILNELTTRKIKLQIEEDNLIDRRKTLTCALSQCVISDSYAVTIDKNQTSQQPNEDVKEEIHPIDSTLLEVVNQLSEIADVDTLCSSSSTSATPVLNASVINSTSSSDNLELQKETACKSPKQYAPEDSDLPKEIEEDNEDIIIIPAVKKVVPVIDLVDSESPTKSKDKKELDLAQNFSELVVHKTVVNTVKVHDGYLYTCSNDFTAKRFNLKDSKDTVVYQHAKRNVLQLCIETFSDTTIVFTLCSNDSRISLFKAMDGVHLKTYSLEGICAGISNGWGKVYAGLKSGLIVTCNRKDSKDLVRNLEPVKSLACTMQGGLRVIIILSISGQVAVRDVERNGLLIRYIKAHNDTPLFMNVYNDYVYLSSSVLLTATNLSTGSVEKKIKLTSPITGLAAFETNIFTTAFTGIVRCYHEGRMLNMKMAYGAGHESLTCIYVYQGWVFTGNRNGVVSVFQFDPFSEYQCQVSNCKNIYMHLEDLDRHVNINSDHKLISKNSKCPWRKCQQAFNKDWNEEARKYHLKTHVKRLSIPITIL